MDTRTETAMQKAEDEEMRLVGVEVWKLKLMFRSVMLTNHF